VDPKAAVHDGDALLIAIASGREYVYEIVYVSVDVGETDEGECVPVAYLQDTLGEEADYDWSEVAWYVPLSELAPSGQQVASEKEER